MKTEDTFDLAVLGLGSAAAYYLSTFDAERTYVDTFDDGKTTITTKRCITRIVAIGLEDPWDKARGHHQGLPSQFINHTKHLIKHLGKKLKGYTDESKLVDRKAWARANAKIIKKVATEVIKGKIGSVEPGISSSDPQKQHLTYFKIQIEGIARTIYARKVVVATGAGLENTEKDNEFHQRPGWVSDAVTKHGVPADRVMDMDVFVRGDGDLMEGKGRTVLVLGHNAAIDAVEDARARKFEVHWFGTASPAFLAGPGYQQGAREVARDRYTLFTEDKKDPPKLSWDGMKLQLSVKVPGKAVERKGDLFVYGQGQQRVVQKVVPFLSEDLVKSLEPIYDVNQRFGEEHERVLGLQLPERNPWNNLEIIGATTKQILDGEKAPDQKLGVTHNYLSRCNLIKVLEQLQVKVKTDYTIVEWVARRAMPDSLYPYKDLYELAASGWTLREAEAEKQKLLDGVLGEVFVLPSRDQQIIRRVAEQLADTCLKCLRTIEYFKAQLAPEAQTLKGPGLAEALKKLKVNSKSNDAALVKTMPKSVGTSGQLVAVKELTAAQQGAIPEYVGGQKWTQRGEYRDPKTGKTCKVLDVQNIKGDLNLSTDDRTMLRVWVAVNYPDIEDCPELSSLMEQILSVRRADDRPWGIDESKFDLELEAKKVHWKQAFAILEKKHQVLRGPRSV